MKKTRGFTMVEILVVLTVFSVFSFCFFGGIVDIVAYYRLKTEIQKIYAIFFRARQEAIFRQENCFVKFNIKKQKLIFATKKKVLAVHSLAEGVKLKKENLKFGGSKEVVFKPLGTAKSGRLTLENKQGQKYALIVYGVTGRIRYQREG